MAVKWGALGGVLAAGVLAVAPAAAVAAPAGADSPVVINEVKTTGDPVGDWVEIANTDDNNSVDVSGWTIIDDNHDHTPITFPPGTEIESGGYLAVYTDTHDDGFGLGSDDEVTLSNADGEVVDFVSWTSHEPTSLGRLPDKTGEFQRTGAPTKGGPNVAEGEELGRGDLPTPWHDAEIVDITVDDPAFFEEDMSGVDFDDHGRAYVVNNDRGVLYGLDPVPGEAAYTVAFVFDLTYPDGTGEPDAEGVTVGPDGAVFVATERDNANNDVSRPSILRFELPADPEGQRGTLAATREWNLKEFTGEIGANAGLEAIAHIPDLPGDTFAVGVEATGEVLVVTLAEDGAELRQRIETSLDGVMALDYQPVEGVLWATCDEACQNASQRLVLDKGTFVLDPADAEYQRPENLPNVANEGFGRFLGVESCAEEGLVRSVARALWADDAVTDGVSLRGSEVLGECRPAPGNPDEGAGPSEPPAPSTPPAPGEDTTGPSEEPGPGEGTAPGEEPGPSEPSEPEGSAEDAGQQAGDPAPTAPATPAPTAPAGQQPGAGAQQKGSGSLAATGPAGLAAAGALGAALLAAGGLALAGSRRAARS